MAPELLLMMGSVAVVLVSVAAAFFMVYLLGEELLALYAKSWV